MSEHVGPTQIVIGGHWFKLDRERNSIELVDRDIVFTPAQLAYVLQQYGQFKVKVADLSRWRMIEGTTEE